MTQADRIINGKFGGIRPAARALGIAKSTVASWVKSGFIPRWHQETVLATAKAKGIALYLQDFFDDGEDRSDAAA